MERKELLIQRIEKMGQVLSERKEVCALMGLGSIGVERQRLDAFSDLDFFVIVDQGYKESYIESLDWLNDTYPLIYQFKNTKDGYKFMFEDGMYGEFAVFDVTEVENLHQAEGKIIYQRHDYDVSLLIQSKGKKPTLYQENVHHACHEALTNIYVGLCRLSRGEWLSGYRFIETYAFNQILSVLHHFEEKVTWMDDPYNIERRFEIHYPIFAKELKHMLQGYDRVHLSALHMLRFLEPHVDIPKPFYQVMINMIENIQSSKV